MKRVNVADAKAHFSAYLREVKNGETLVICERNVPIAEVRAVGSQAKPERVLGRYDGVVQFDDSVFAPMTNEEVAEFEDDPANPLNRL